MDNHCRVSKEIEITQKEINDDYKKIHSYGTPHTLSEMQDIARLTHKIGNNQLLVSRLFSLMARCEDDLK